MSLLARIRFRDSTFRRPTGVGYYAAGRRRELYRDRAARRPVDVADDDQLKLPGVDGFLDFLRAGYLRGGVPD